MDTATFQHEFLSRATQPNEVDPAAVVADYLDIRAATIAQAEALGVGGEGLAQVRRKLARAFVRRWMMLRYAAIDLSFVARKWWIVVERAAESEPAIVNTFDAEPVGIPEDATLRLIGSCPRFFRTETSARAFALGRSDGDGTEASYKLGSLVAGRRKTVSFRTVDVSVRARVPDGITAAHAKAAREAMAHLMMGEAALLYRGVELASEVAETGYVRDRDDMSNPTVAVIWAPNVDVLTIRVSPPRPAGDPAIVLHVAGHDFLLDFYDTPDEQPIEHLIREFSEGKLSR